MLMDSLLMLLNRRYFLNHLICYCKLFQHFLGRSKNRHNIILIELNFESFVHF